MPLKMDFNRIFMFLTVAVLLLLAPELAHAIPMPPGFEVPETDRSRAMLKMLLGDVVDVADGTIARSDGNITAITQVLAAIAPIVSITGALLLTYTMMVGVMNTANEGETMGKRWSTMWIPARSSAAMALILPVPAFGGMSGIQLVVIWLTLVGSGGANIVWNASADAFTARPVYMEPVNVDTSMITAAVSAYTCGYLNQKYMSDSGRISGDPSNPSQQGSASGAGTLVIKESRTTLKDGSIVENIVFTNQGFDVNCGMLQYPVGYDPDYKVSAMQDIRSADGVMSSIGRGFSHMGNWVSGGAVFGHDLFLDGANARQELTIAVANNYGNATREMINQFAEPLARSIVYGDGDIELDRANIRAQILRYDQNMNRAAIDNSEAVVDRMVESFKADVERDGWLMAGVYFWRLVSMQEALSEATNNSAAVTPPDEESVVMAVESETLANTYPLYAERIDDALEYITAFGASGKPSSAANNTEEFNDASILDGPMDMVFSYMGRSVLSWMSDSSDNPLMALKNLGDNLLAIVGWIFVAFGVVKLVSLFPATKAGGYTAKALGKVVGGDDGGGIGGFIMFMMTALAVTLIIVAFTFAYYLPAIPFIIWVAAVMGWLIYTMEALIAAPLWIVMHAHPDGEGPAGSHGAPGYMILLSLILRPTLLVVGLVTSLGILYVMGFFLKETLIISQSYLDPESSRGFFANVSIIILYAAIMYKIINESFEQIHALASSVMGWIGGSAKNLGESGAQEQVRSTVLAGAGVIRQGTQAGMSQMMGGQDDNAALKKLLADRNKAGGNNSSPSGAVDDSVGNTEVAGSTEKAAPQPVGSQNPASSEPEKREF